MFNLQKQYSWLYNETGPRLLKEMLNLLGTEEVKGDADNPTILSWASATGLKDVYKKDSIAWCGLAMSYAAAQAGWDYTPKGNALWARNWAFWGNPVDKNDAMLGDVLVFTRAKGGHVALYVGEDDTHFHILGGNQDDAVNIKRRSKKQLIAVRRCPWKVNQPSNVRKIKLLPFGSIAESEQ